jgi:secretion/DNA translocation related TadE-like protein
VLAIGLVAVLAASMVAVGTVSQAVGARQRAVAAADLAALAGAQALIDGLGPEQACAEARRVAEGSGAALTGCAPEGPQQLRATCEAPIRLGVLGSRAARATALAGPP